MCRMNYQPVNEYSSPCGNCPEYLINCMPVIVDSIIIGECDLVACEFCDEDCVERSY